MAWRFRALALPHDAAEWRALVAAIPAADVYFTPEYSALFAGGHGGPVDAVFCGEPLLLYHGDSENYVVHPVVKRPIAGAPEPCFDLVSPYGYTGPLCHLTDPRRREDLVEAFWSESHAYCADTRIVSEFVRFHPLLENHAWTSRQPPVDARNVTVYVDLRGGPDAALAQMSAKARSSVRKATRAGVKVTRADTSESLTAFVALYHATMDRVGARPEYRFPASFFERMADLLGARMAVFLAEHDGERIAATVVYRHGRLGQYAFSGSSASHWSLGPNQILLLEAEHWAREAGVELFHLGGGHAGPDDSLFHFKAGFSPYRSRFHTMSRIHIPALYDRLVEIREGGDAGAPEGRPAGSAFFPRYRR